ncbi:MAG: hypothetical protein KatS3mg054_1093 [Chloroflexus sp.]|nr:MAG: hypothetical protein KatS3mg054_1093 [Chloroflexus sp.]GIV93058.1 MAG: hypothetical protein KatS3mg056_1767 [Chloroflexus sp.]
MGQLPHSGPSISDIKSDDPDVPFCYSYSPCPLCDNVHRHVPLRNSRIAVEGIDMLVKEQI